MSRLFDFLIARPKSTLLAVTTFTLLIGLGALRLRIDFSPQQVYIGEDNSVEFSEAHKKMFRFEDSIVLVVLEAVDEQSLLREDCLRWMKDLADGVRDLEGVRVVTSLATLERPRINIRGNDRVTWSHLLSEELYSDRDYLLDRVERLPLLNDTLISSDNQMMMTLIDLDPAARSITAVTERVNAITDVIARLPTPANTDTFVSGVPAIRVDVINSIIRDQTQMVPLCSALFLVVSFIIFRSFKVTLLCLVAALTSVVMTMGLMGWFGIMFSVMSNMIPALLLIIGAANNVHVLSRFQVEVRQSGNDYATCAKTTMMEMSRTCLLTLATTGIGFGSLLVARSELLQSLAVQAAAGMACCYFGLMFVLPQTLILCGSALARRADNNHKKSSPAADSTVPATTENVRLKTSRLDTMWKTFGTMIGRYSVAIVAFHLLLAGWTVWSARNIPVNSYMFETYDGDHPTMEAVRKIDEHMSGLISLEIQLQADTREELFQPEVALALAKVREAIGLDERVTFYRDYIEFLSSFDRGRTLEGDSEAIGASLKRIQLALRQIGDPEVTSSFLAREEPAARVMMRIHDVGSAGMKALIADVDVILKKELPQNISFAITGDAYLHAFCMDAFVRDLFTSLVTASGVIFLLITLLFRSLRIGLIAAVPNMFPLVMTLGYLHLRGYELTAGNVLVFAISLGIAVDDTIHFLARFRDERRNAEPLEAVRNTLHTSGRAIVLTSVLVVSGLSVLIFSDFVPTRRFAELTAITMCSALPGDVILLPALLNLFAGRGRRQVQTETPTDLGEPQGDN
ncbi:efflux RND transporter permease subunit [Fuerstiella marisgermanici]|uniref:Bifunctional preprotein translocase subunit n=1 Tax=Fuerstiella marisgermanici TaxID=1891926 RepID=A0A1P8WIP7_9PLAN|nr:MMPL family transporter [Fuerstiella marisgermanici]APZ93939.1 bifunctional preprotein translocase subunit [Fuerstiella marisgermanici]